MAVDTLARTLAAGMTQVANDIKTAMDNMEDEFAIAKAQVGTPLVAATASAMTDHNKIYVYTGSESGYTNGHWYYWNGSAWADGGVYNSTALQTDTTLSISGMAADAKVTGDDITDLKNALFDNIALEFSLQMSNYAVDTSGHIVSAPGYSIYNCNVTSWVGKRIYIDVTTNGQYAAAYYYTVAGITNGFIGFDHNFENLKLARAVSQFCQVRQGES